MATNDNLQDYLTALGNSFRYATNSTEKINAQDMLTLPAQLGDAYKDYQKIIEQNYNYGENINIPLGVKRIGQSRFNSSSVINVFNIIIPEGVTKIQNDNFVGYGYKELHIPTTLTMMASGCCTYRESSQYPKYVYCKDLTAFLNIKGSGTNGEFWSKECTKSFLDTNCEGGNLYLNDEKVVNVVVPKEITQLRKFQGWGIAGNFSFEEGTQITNIQGTPFCNKLYLPKSGYSITGNLGDCNEIHYNGDMFDYLQIPHNTAGVFFSSSKVYFDNKLVEEIIIPSGVVDISKNIFYYFNKFSIKNVVIPTSVSNIGNNTFYGSTNGQKIVVRFLGTTPPTIQNSTFNWNTIEKVIVPASALNTFKSATNFSAGASKIVPDSNIEVSIDSSLLNNENILYSIDGGEKQQFTNTTLSLEGVGTLTIYNTSTDTIKLGSTSGGSEIGTSGPNTTITYTFTDVSTLYITKA